MIGHGVEQVVFLQGRGLGPESDDVVAPAFPGARLLAPKGGVELRRRRIWFEKKRIGVAHPDSVAAAEARVLAWCQHGPFWGPRLLAVRVQ